MSKKDGTALLGLLAIGLASISVAAVDIQYQPDGSVLVTGIEPQAVLALKEHDLSHAQWVNVFSLHIVSPDATGLPAVHGRTTIEGTALRFQPHFPLARGESFRGRFDGTALGALTGRVVEASVVTQTFAVPQANERPPTNVTAVFPSGELVPANLLRIYVWFSAPMHAKGIADHIRVHLIDASIENKDAPKRQDQTFVEIANGLWDPSGQRLTLLIHPGRIKRGVGPNTSLGPPLLEGRRYRLSIDAAARDASGQPLGKPFHRDFVIGPADRTSPDPHTWTLHKPATPKAALVIEFPEPLDRALLERLLVVEDKTGRSVSGRININDGETKWTYTPDAAWAIGEYRVAVHPALEDLAGNTPHYLFDAETELPETEQQPDSAAESNAIELSFQIATAGS